MSPEVALNRISPMLSPFISSVVRNGKVGLDATNCLRITDLKSGSATLMVTRNGVHICDFCELKGVYPVGHRICKSCKMRRLDF